MRKLRPDKFRRFLLIALLSIIVLVFIIKFFSSISKKSGQSNYVTIEVAPQSLLYRDSRSTHYVGGGASYQVDESGSLRITIDGKNYIVRSDGSVWQEKEDGSYEKVSDKKIINTVLTTALVAIDEDSSLSNIVDEESIARNIDIASLTDEQISVISDIFNVSSKELENIVNQTEENGQNISLSDSLNTLDLTRLSDSQLDYLADSLGVDNTVLKEIVQKKKDENETISLNEALTEVLKNDDIVLLQSYLNSILSDNPDYFKNLGLPDITAESILDQLEHSFNSQTGFPYTANEFMNIALKDGIKEALKAIGFSLTDDSALLTYNNSSSNSSLGNAPGSFLGDSSSYPSYNPSDDLTYLANALSENSNSSYISQNGQEAKKSFLASQQNGTTTTVAKNIYNMLTAGTIINGTLVTAINTDLPGQIVAIVSQNVYDSFNQTNLLIPKGSRLVATYDSSVSWGQDRILIAWNQLIRPDGLIMSLNGYQGIDSQGFAGQAGKVSNHIFSIVGATGVASMIEYFSQSSMLNIENGLLNALAGGTSNAVSNVAGELLEKAINRQPTITVPIATKISILVNDNVVIPTYKE